MTTRTDAILTGNRNQCPQCGELFNSLSAFDAHRYGPHEDNGRRCLTPAQMTARGMIRVGRWWVTSLREKA